MGHYKIQLDEEDRDEGANIEIQRVDGSTLFHINVFEHDGGKGTADVIIDDSNQQGRFLSWKDGKIEFAQSVNAKVLAVEVSPLPHAKKHFISNHPSAG